MRKHNATCNICGKTIYIRPSQLQKNNGKAFCSQTCYGKSCQKPRICPICGSTFLAGKSRAKTCSRACSNKSRTGTIYNRTRSLDLSVQGQALRQRLIRVRGNACEVCGYNIVACLQTHHIIPKARKGTDDLSNVLLVCPNCHSEIHHNIEIGRDWSQKPVPGRICTSV